MRQIPHLGIGSYILIDVELILLVPLGVRLNPAGGVDHMAGGFLDTRVRSGTHRRQDGRAQDPRIGDLGERNGHATHVGMGPAWVCIHNWLLTGPPLAMISFGTKPFSRSVRKMCSLP